MIAITRTLESTGRDVAAALVGREVFDTVLWIGRFIEAWQAHGGEYQLIYRRQVKLRKRPGNASCPRALNQVGLIDGANDGAANR